MFFLGLLIFAVSVFLGFVSQKRDVAKKCEAMLETRLTNPVQVEWGRGENKDSVTFVLEPSLYTYYVTAKGGGAKGLPPHAFHSSSTTTKYVVDMSKYKLEDRAIITSHSYALLDRSPSVAQFRKMLSTDNSRHTVRFPLAESGRITQSDLDVGTTHFELQGNLYAVDIAAPMGTGVTSATSGVVVEVESSYPDLGCDNLKYVDYSNNILVLNDDGSQTIYGHLKQNSILVRPGQRIKTGELIGQVGRPGAAGQPHLHFSIGGILDDQLVTFPLSFQCESGTVFEPKGQINCR